jgi:hypothetical protein
MKTIGVIGNGNSEALGAILATLGSGVEVLTYERADVPRSIPMPHDRRLRGINIEAELVLIREKRSYLPASLRKLIVKKYGKGGAV